MSHTNCLTIEPGEKEMPVTEREWITIDVSDDEIEAGAKAILHRRSQHFIATPAKNFEGYARTRIALDDARDVLIAAARVRQAKK
jgi:hypothetical protein